MDYIKVIKFSNEEKEKLFYKTSNLLRTNKLHIEKDFWICIVLDKFFHHLSDGYPSMIFKGGTSLSKSYNLINRFSEDIDIVMSREDLGFTNYNPQIERPW